MKIYIAVSSVDDWAGMMTQGSAYNLYPVMLESVPTDTPKPYYFCLDYLHELGHSSFPHSQIVTPYIIQSKHYYICGCPM